MSFLLVIAAAITLVIGLLSTGLALIFVSIACSLLAALLLAVAVVRSRPKEEVKTGAPPPIQERGEAPPAEEPPRRPEPAQAPAAEQPQPQRAEAPPAPTPPPPPRPEPQPAAAAPAPPPDGWEVPAASEKQPEGEGLVFPIADYDDLKVAEITPLLGELDAVELRMVREREIAGANRSGLLKSIDSRLAAAGAAPPPLPGAAGAEVGAEGVPAKSAAAKKLASKSTSKTTKKRAGKTLAKASPATGSSRSGSGSQASAKSAAAKKLASKSTSKTTKKQSGSTLAKKSRAKKTGGTKKS